MTEAFPGKRSFLGPLGHEYLHLSDDALELEMYLLENQKVYETMPEEAVSKIKEQISSQAFSTDWVRELSRMHGELRVDINLYPKEFCLAYRYSIIEKAGETTVGAGEKDIGHRDVMQIIRELPLSERAAMLERAKR